MRYRKIPDETIKRLPIYLRKAIHLSEGEVECVSSKELAIDSPYLTGKRPWERLTHLPLVYVKGKTPSPSASHKW